jgi:hypothetical protein
VPATIGKLEQLDKLPDDGVFKALLLLSALALPAVKLAAVPLQLVKVPAEGVPRLGVVSTGLACMTKVEPVPV